MNQAAERPSADEHLYNLIVSLNALAKHADTLPTDRLWVMKGYVEDAAKRFQLMLAMRGELNN